MPITKKSCFPIWLKKIVCFLLLLFLFSLLTNLSLVNHVRAEEGWLDMVKQGGLNEIRDKAYGQSSDQPSNSMVMVMARIIKVFLDLLGIIFLALLVWAGFKWMTAGGDEDKVKEAKSQITTAVIGLVIIFAAYSIAHFVFCRLIYLTTGLEYSSECLF